MSSPTWWTRVWAGSGGWWWTGKLGMLQSMGSQRVAQDWATELNWILRKWEEEVVIYFIKIFLTAYLVSWICVIQGLLLNFLINKRKKCFSSFACFLYFIRCYALISVIYQTQLNRTSCSAQVLLSDSTWSRLFVPKHLLLTSWKIKISWFFFQRFWFSKPETRESCFFKSSLAFGTAGIGKDIKRTGHCELSPGHFLEVNCCLKSPMWAFIVLCHSRLGRFGEVWSLLF